MQTYFMESIIVLLFALANLALLLSFLASKNGSTILYNFMLVFALFLILALLEGSRFGVFFATLEFLTNKLVPNAIIRFFESMKNSGELPEESLVKIGLLFVAKVFEGQR